MLAFRTAEARYVERLLASSDNLDFLGEVLTEWFFECVEFLLA